MGFANGEDAEELAEHDGRWKAWRCLLGGGAIRPGRREGASLLEAALEMPQLLWRGELEGVLDDFFELALESGVTS